MLVIRLQRTGRGNEPAFRLVVAEHSAPVKGRFKEMLGFYLPAHDPVELKFNEERITHWVSLGAQPSNTVARLLSKHGMKGLEKYFKTYTKRKPKKAPAEPAKEEKAPEESKGQADVGDKGKEE